MSEYQTLLEMPEPELNSYYTKLGRRYPLNGLVYFISDGNFVKIGMTTNCYIQSRISAMQTANPNRLIMIGFVVCELIPHDWIGIQSQMISHEKAIQLRFEKSRKRMEWFSISDEEIFLYKDITRTSELFKGKLRQFLCYPEIRKTCIERRCSV